MRESEIRETLYQYEQTADELLAGADKAVIERAARMLALYVGYYQLRHGPIPPTALATPDDILSSAEQFADRIEAMRILAAALTIAAHPRSMPTKCVLARTSEYVRERLHRSRACG